MLRNVLYAVCTILVLHRVQCAGPPTVNGSYIAWGEITQPVKGMGGIELQATFEESYDADNKNSAFVVWMAGQNVTFIQNFKTNQTFRYTEGEDCTLTDETEWVTSDYPPGLLLYEDTNGTVKFSIRQLLNLPERYLVKNKVNVKSVYRGVPARMWLYEIQGLDDRQTKKTLNIYSYWSDGTWNTSSNEAIVPLGFIVAKTFRTLNVSVEEVVTSVFGFVTGTYDRKLFEPVQGTICANRSQTLKFPSVQNIKAISIHSEMVLPDYQEIRYTDTWFDPQNQLVRIDVSRIRDEDPISQLKTKRYESEIAIGQMGVVFRQNVFKDKFSCDVIQFKGYRNDIQNFIDVKQNLTKWQMGKLFGLNDTTYVYTGKTVKGDIPCHVFQGIRTDWPEESANVTSLWEWCFNLEMSKERNVLFLNDEVGLINAQVTILSSGVEQDYSPGFRMFHHFYEVTEKDPDILDATRFDISKCFDADSKQFLQFSLDMKITNDNQHLAENLTSDVGFLQKWKSAIYEYTGIPKYSLRIAKMTSTIADKKIYIMFLLLNLHPKLPHDIEQISSSDAEKALRDKVDSGGVAIKYKMGKEMLPFAASPRSLSPQINPDFEHHTIAPFTLPTPKPTTPSTNFPFSLRTEPETGSKTSVKDKEVTGSSSTGVGDITGTGTTGTGTDIPVQKTTLPGDLKTIFKKTGHQPGTVAAVSISMILVGVSVGCAGTFYKYYGLPSCARS